MPRAHIPFEIPVGLNASRKAIQEHAREMIRLAARAKGLSPKEARNPHDLVRAFGGKVHLEERSDLSLEVYGTQGFNIYYGSLGGAATDYLRIAQNLGHYLLHYPAVRNKQPGSGMQVTTLSDHELSTDDIARREALWFAHEALMPEDELRTHFEAGGIDRCMTMMCPLIRSHLEDRLKKLGIIQPEQAE